MTHTIWLAPGKFGKQKKEDDFIREELTDVPPFPCDFQVGNIVTYTNENGVVFPGMKITGFSKKEDAFNGRFIHLGGESFWFPNKPEALTLERRLSAG